jgi:hypothetical protein
MKSPTINNDQKQCTECLEVKHVSAFRRQRNACILCEKKRDQERCSGDRVCTNCNLFKLENQFDKYSRHCKLCKSIKGRSKILKLKNNPDQTEYFFHLQRNSKNNMKMYRKRDEKFDTIPLEECYEEYLSVLRKNANSRATKSQIVCNIDLPFLVDLFVKQNGKCALTGLSFNLVKYETKRAFAPSIDRVDCNAGYTKDNVRLVCLVVNLALNDFGDQVFDIMCRGYIKHNV